MKARIKATGEIVNLPDNENIMVEVRDNYGGRIIKYSINELEIIDENSDMPSEQRMRYELIKYAMPSLIESKYRTSNAVPNIVKDTLEIIDEVIKQLKEYDNE